MWTDPYAKFHDGNDSVESRISATVFKEGGAFLYRIKFAGSTYGLNVAVRPKENMMHLVRDFRKILISVKSPEKKPIGFRVRVVDEQSIHWAFGEYMLNEKGNPISENKYKLVCYSSNTRISNASKDLQTDKSDFQTFEIPLDKINWVHFNYDGPKFIDSVWETNRPFEFISLVILEVGFPSDTSCSERNKDNKKLVYRPNETGVIDIGKIWFE